MTIRAAVLALALLCSACPSPDPPPGRGSPTGTAQPARGGALKVVLAGDVDSLDPHGAARPSSWFFARALHRGLLAFPAAPMPDGARPVADLAAAVPKDTDGSFAITLRDGVTFANGDAIRNTDVVASIARLRRTGRGIAPYLKGVRARALPDGRIGFSGGRADLPWLLAHPQAAIVPASTPRWGRVAARRVVGAGPYRVSSSRPERSIVLVRNDRWRIELDPVRGGYVDRIEARIGIDAVAQAKAIADGSADLIADPGPPDLQVPTVPEKGRSAVVQTGCLRYLFLNTTTRPFGDAPARRAVASAVRRLRLPGAGKASAPAFRLIPPVVVGHSVEPVLPEDVDAAKRYVREAGRRSLRADLVVADSPRDLAEARAIRTALRRANIVVRIRPVPAAVVSVDRYEQPGARTQMGLATWCADWPGLAGRSMLSPLALSSAPRSTRYSGLRSKRVDDLLARAGSRASDWSAADRAIVSSGAIVPLLWPNEVNLLSERIEGWSGAPMFPRGDPTTLWLG